MLQSPRDSVPDVSPLVFSALRAFVLSRSKLLGVLVLALSLVPVGANLVSGSVGVNQLDRGRPGDIPGRIQLSALWSETPAIRMRQDRRHDSGSLLKVSF